MNRDDHADDLAQWKTGRMATVTWGAASYGGTYGAPGGVIVLLMWFYPQSFAIVLGAEESTRISVEMEHQTAVDTKKGPPAPMSQRGASVAAYLWWVIGLGGTPE